jgi:heat shock protein HslJ
MKTLKSFVILVVFLIVSSCGGLKSINPLSLLTGNSWALSSLMGEGLDPSQFTGTIPSLDFLEGGKLAGYSGCNNFSGSFSLEGTAVKLDPGAITKKACPSAGEQDFLSAIEKVSQLKVDRNKLTLLDGATELMSFVPKND